MVEPIAENGDVVTEVLDTMLFLEHRTLCLPTTLIEVDAIYNMRQFQHPSLDIQIGLDEDRGRNVPLEPGRR